MSDETARHAMRRKPLFTPVFIAGALGVIAVLVLGWLAYGFLQSPGTVVVVRHVEKAAEPADNPGPSPAGEARAVELADLLGPLGVDAIYASNYLRTFATAAPLAQRASLPVHVYDARDTRALIADLDARYRYGTVLVVGHSNTVPDIVRALSGRRVGAIDESRYGDVFIIIRPRWGRATVIHLFQPASHLP